jgi:hypothetical protein
MGLSHRMSVSILYVISAALGLVSIALADKGLLVAILLVVLILIFVIGGIRNLTGMRSEKEEQEEMHGAAELQSTDGPSKGVEEPLGAEALQNAEQLLNAEQLQSADGPLKDWNSKPAGSGEPDAKMDAPGPEEQA